VLKSSGSRRMDAATGLGQGMVNEVSDGQPSTLDLWRRGVPLSEAWWRFASPEMRRRFHRPKMSRKLNPKTGLGMWAEAVRDRPEVVKGILQYKRLNDRQSGRMHAREDMQKTLVVRLHNGSLLAVGFTPEGTLDASPIQIPIKALLNFRTFLWDVDRISAPPHEFTSVRIVPSRKLKSNVSNPERHSESIRRGRPPVGEVLRAIVRELRQAGVFAGKLKKEKVAMVGGTARERHPTQFPRRTQPSPTTIRDALKAEGE
jgi:hypothetical protein